MGAYNMMDKVEAAWKGQLVKNSFIIANSVYVGLFRKTLLEQKNGIYVYARVPFTENDRNQDTWQVWTEIRCITFTPSDRSLVILRTYIEAVFQVALKDTYADFSQSGGVTVSGIDFNNIPEEEYDDNTQIVTLNLITHIENVEA